MMVNGTTIQYEVDFRGQYTTFNNEQNAYRIQSAKGPELAKCCQTIQTKNLTFRFVKQNKR